MVSCSFTHNEQLSLAWNEVGVEEWSLKSVQFLERTSSKVLGWSQERGELRASPSSPGVEERGSERARKCNRGRQTQLQGVRPQGKLKKTRPTLGRAHHSIMSHPVMSYCQLCFETIHHQKL